MPLNGSGTYSSPPGTTATPNTTILSAAYNALVADLTTVLNTARPIAYGGTGGTSVITGWDGLASKGTDIATAGTINLTTATGPSLTLTGVVTITAVTLAEGSFRLVRAAGAFQITASASLLCNGSSSVNMTVAAEDLLVFRGSAGGVVDVVKLGGGSTAATNAQALAATSAAVSLTPANLAQERALGVQPMNLALAASVGSSALTVSLKGVDGNDPSATNPVTIMFRNATLATGTPVPRLVTAATSIVVASTKTLGTVSATIARLWIVAVDTGSGIELGIVNCLSGPSIMALRAGIYSPTATPGNSAQVIYTTSGQTSKPIAILGYIEATEATAGTWATAPSLIKIWQPGDPLPGDTVQSQRNETGAMATGATTIPLDNTIPQITEGNEFMTQAITPVSGANLLAVSSGASLSDATAAAQIGFGLWRDATANAIAVGNQYQPTGAVVYFSTMTKSVLAGSTSLTTFRFRAGGNSGTVTFNGASSAQLYGGAMGSFMEVKEIMA